ncbi:glycosyltransferase family 4 protein [Aquincola tertiaricarbonis]|uniref:glycosyltransferase family 4 protein n=1 Tax=Aquincola tertiaricarbonis TaxID=391953 RepID=UPI000614BF8C|nr:glycosyltransferase family 1 protein [Aquincola tertiaricarbonis]
MDALRVAFVTETYPPEVNGVATTTKQFVEGLQARGHAVQLLRPRQQAADAAVQRPGLQEVLLPGLAIPGYAQLRMGLPATGTLLRLWRRQRPDVVHVATEGPLGWSALRAAQRLGLPVSSDFRTNFDAYSRHYGIGWLQRPITAYLRRFHNRCGCTLVPTEPLRQRLARSGFERLHVVPRGVDTGRFGPAHRSPALRAQWGAAADDLVLGCVGRLAPEKGLLLAIEAFHRLRGRQARLRLVLVGDGPQRAALQAACPDAVFAGVQQGHALAAHYASFDLFLFPSQTETFGNATVEAMASGLPVVAFDHAAAGQLISPGRNGLLAPLDDGAAFLSLAAQAAGDAAWRARLGEAARQTALALGWDSVVHGFEARLVQVARGEALPAVRPALPADVDLNQPAR